MARAKRQATAGDMIRSLAVLLVPLLIIIVLFTRNLDDHPITVVDYQPALALARDEAPYDVLAPVALPEDWRATRVSWTKAGNPDPGGNISVRNAWQLGFLDPDDTYIELRQGDLEGPSLIRDASREGIDDGTSAVGGQTWRRLVSTDERTRTLALATPSVTTVVVGDVPYAELEAFASTLEGRVDK